MPSSSMYHLLYTGQARDMATTGVQRAQRVTLYARTGLDYVLVVIQQHRRRSIAPFRPRCHLRKHLTRRLHEVISTDLVERIPKINL